MSCLPVEVLSPGECARLLGACSRSCRTGVRNRALLTVMYRGGLRIGEALALEVRDVDQGVLNVRSGKGGKQRRVGLDPLACEVLGDWLVVRKALPGARVFCTLAGEPLWPSYVRSMVKRVAAKAGIDKRVHPHGLRHTHAVELSMEGVPLHVIRDQLGHSSAATTDRYLRRVSAREVVTTMQGREWSL